MNIDHSRPLDALAKFHHEDIFAGAFAGELICHFMKHLLKLVALFLVAVLPAGLVAQHRASEAQVQRQGMLEPARDTLCDRLVREEVPSFARDAREKGWIMQCVDGVAIPENTAFYEEVKHASLAGVSDPFTKVISVKRKQSEPALRHVIVHEWVHATEFAHQGPLGRRYEEDFLNYVKDFVTDAPGESYNQALSEILADSVATCWTPGGLRRSHITLVPCGVLWSAYPRYAPDDSARIL